MYKLIILTTLLAMSMAAPKPSSVVYSSLLTPVSPHVVTSVVSPAVTSYSTYSNAVVHGSPVVTVPVVQSARLVPVQETAVVHTYTYPHSVVVA